MPRTLDTRKGRAKRTFRKANMVSIDFVYVYWEVVGGNEWIRRRCTDLYSHQVGLDKGALARSKSSPPSVEILEIVDHYTAFVGPRSCIPFGCGEIDAPELLEGVG
jgi:hypothetical protein